MSEPLNQSDSALARPKSGRGVPLLMLLGLLLLGGAALFAAGRMVDEREARLVSELETRMTLALEGRAAVLANHLDQQREAAVRFAAHPVVRLHAAEAAAGEPIGNAGSPHLQSLLNDFRREYALAGAQLLGSDGEPLLAAADAPPLDEAQRAVARLALERVDTSLSPIAGSPPLLHLAVPLAPLQRLAERADNPPAGVLIATLPFAERRRALEGDTLLGLPGERLRLLQPGERALKSVDGVASDLGPALRELPFEATSSGGYRIGLPVAGTDWLLLHEVVGAELLAPLAPFRLTVHLAAVLFTALAALLALAVWLRQRAAGDRALAAQYHALAEAMHTQNQLIEEINSAVGEHISLKGPDNRYQYVNHAFARALGRNPEGMLGRLDAELFNSRDARRLENLDRLTEEGGETVHAAATLRLGGGMRHFELSKTPFRDAEGRPAGIVTVARDVTDLIEQKRRSEMLIKQTTTAIGYLAEASDPPHFGGQTKMIGKVATGIAKGMRLDADVVTTLEIAANLCHVGKLSLPPAIRYKEGRFTAEEFELMKDHMADADRLLGEIHFDLPVREAVVQMYERLDGSGYPSGLIGDDITREARILGVANVFVAHINARPYREALSVESALEYLRGNPGQFDAEVVEALARLVEESRRKGRG